MRAIDLQKYFFEIWFSTTNKNENILIFYVDWKLWSISKLFRYIKNDLHVQQESVRNCRREKSKTLRKQPVTPKIKNTKAKLKVASCSTKASVLINEDIFVEGIEWTVSLSNRRIESD